MPTKTVAAETMEVGKKGGGKHWTQAEIDARQQVAEELKRKNKVDLMPPVWLSKDARAVWKAKLDQVRGLNAANELLDVLDTEMLAVYCDAYVQYLNAAKKKTKSPDDIKELQAWSRIISTYAEKLGFNPSARARLVKKRVEAKKDGMSQFD